MTAAPRDARRAALSAMSLGKGELWGETDSTSGKGCYVKRAVVPPMLSIA